MWDTLPIADGRTLEAMAPRGPPDHFHTNAKERSWNV